MNSAIERILSLRVSDVMTRQVRTVVDHQTMASAADELLSHDLSGAPVVDAQQHLVGMLTATDFMRWESQRAHGEGEQRVDMTAPDEAWQVECLPDELVSRHMCAAVQSIAANDTLMAAARTMCRGHVHRLPVVGEHGELLGVVSTLDIVAAVVQAVEE